MSTLLVFKLKSPSCCAHYRLPPYTTTIPFALSAAKLRGAGTPQGQRAPRRRMRSTAREQPMSTSRNEEDTAGLMKRATVGGLIIKDAGG